MCPWGSCVSAVNSRSSLGSGEQMPACLCVLIAFFVAPLRNKVVTRWERSHLLWLQESWLVRVLERLGQSTFQSSFPPLFQSDTLVSSWSAATAPCCFCKRWGVHKWRQWQVRKLYHLSVPAFLMASNMCHMKIATGLSLLCPVLLIILWLKRWGCLDSRDVRCLLSLFSMAKGGFSNCHY